jgi:hypothetical protein
MTRAEAAHLLRRHRSWVRRREGTELHPVVGRDGWHRFDETEVLALALRLGQPSDSREVAAGLVDAKTAASVFGALDRGMDGVRIVIDEGIHPVVVLRLRDLWRTFAGELVLSAALVAELNRLRWPGGPEDLRDSEELVARVRALIDCLQEQRRTACGRCEARPARLCGACVRHMRDMERRPRPSSA